MPGKTQLVNLLDRSAKVVEVELNLLDRWRIGSTPGRQAQIDFVARYIGVDTPCARRRTAFVLNEAKALADAVHAPDQAHESAVEQTVNSIAARLTWDGPNLSDDAFANALLLARHNADQAANNSDAIFADCTSAGGVGPLALVAAPKEMVAALNFDGGGIGSKSKRRRKKPT